MADETPDDLANAALDGDERALEVARSNPDLQRLVDEHRRVKTALRAEPTPVPREDRQHHLEAALAVFDEMQIAAAPEADNAPSSDTTVVSLASKRRRNRRWLNVAAAAAVVSVGAIGAVGLTSGDEDSDDAANAAGESVTTTSQTSTDDAVVADSPAASRAAPVEEDFDAAESELNIEPFTADTEDRVATTAAASVAPPDGVDSAESLAEAIFPEGPLDPRFVECLARFDVPDRPWVVSATISDTSGVLELLVGDDFDTLYRFVFDPSSCLLILPAEPFPDE